MATIKRDAERQGKRPPSGKLADKLPETAPARFTEELTWPPANGEWHDVAKMTYQSLQDSGQSQFYEPSDVAVAFLLCESMSRDLQEQFVAATPDGTPIYEVIPLKGASLTAYSKVFGSLMMTEGDRRKLRLELERAKPAASGPTGVVVDFEEMQRQRAGQVPS